MRFLDAPAAKILANPWAFSLQVIRAFNANQGMLLAGAVAYYALLSIVPFMILMLLALSSVMDHQVLMDMLSRTVEHVAPGQGKALVRELESFLAHRHVIGGVLIVTLVFFSSLAFRTLENAISVMFVHRMAERSRPFWISVLMPFAYILFIGVGLFAGTVLLSQLLAVSDEAPVIFGYAIPLDGVTRLLLYAAGVAGQVLIIASIYYYMPAARISAKHALIGGAVAGVLWEVMRRVIAWYYSTHSSVGVVYGSLTTAIVVLLGLEIAAILLLLGAQVIAEYDRLGREAGREAPPS